MDDIACAVIETRENIFLYFENIFVSSSLIRNEREREREDRSEVLGRTLDM